MALDARGRDWLYARSRAGREPRRGVARRVRRGVMLRVPCQPLGVRLHNLSGVWPTLTAELRSTLEVEYGSTLGVERGSTLEGEPGRLASITARRRRLVCCFTRRLSKRRSISSHRDSKLGQQSTRPGGSNGCRSGRVGGRRMASPCRDPVRNVPPFGESTRGDPAPSVLLRPGGTRGDLSVCTCATSADGDPVFAGEAVKVDVCLTIL